MVFRRISLLILTTLLVPMPAQAMPNPIKWVWSLQPIYWVGNKTDRFTERCLHLLANRNRYKQDFYQLVIPAVSTTTTLFSEKNGDFKKVRQLQINNQYASQTTYFLDAVQTVIDDITNNRVRVSSPLQNFPEVLAEVPYPQVINTQPILAAKEMVKRSLGNCDAQSYQHLRGLLAHLENIHSLSNSNTRTLAYETCKVIVGAAVIIGITGWLIKKKYNQWKNPKEKDAKSSIQQELENVQA